MPAVEGVTARLDRGCWAVQLLPYLADDYESILAVDSPLHGWTVRYLGTLRIESCDRDGKSDPTGKSEYRRASGDLYVERHPWATSGRQGPRPHLPHCTAIPIFPRRDYSFYFTVEDLVAHKDGSLEVELASFQFDSKSLAWGPAQKLTALLKQPNEGDLLKVWRREPLRYLSGDVCNDRGSLVARFDMAWISPFLREAHLGIKVAHGLKPPLDNHEDDSLKSHHDSVRSVLADVDWKVHIAEPVEATVMATVWEEKDLHAEMLALRAKANFDREWIYHALVVPRFLETEVYGFGKMYDGGALDTDLVPREGLVVAAAARFPAELRFGSAAGKQLQEVRPAAFCDFMHELGHAMGLLHRYRGQGFMQELLYFANVATPLKPFPTNLTFKYDPQDELRLRHHPDIWVRPGGVPFAAGYSVAPVPDDDILTDVSDELALTTKPLVNVVPLGAPVRLQLQLTNRTDRTLPGPARLSLADGVLAGSVIAPSGETQTFSAAAPLDYDVRAELAPGQSLCHGETIWRGSDGALFPAPGLYRIVLEAGWVGLGGLAKTTTHCDVLISAPCNLRHEQAAFRLLECADIMVLVVFRSSPHGGSAASSQRIAAATEVLRDSLNVEELCPSLAPIEARLLASRGLEQAAAQLIDARSLLTTSEIDYLLTKMPTSGNDAGQCASIRRLIAVCRYKVELAFRAGQIDEAELWRLLGQILDLERTFGSEERCP